MQELKTVCPHDCPDTCSIIAKVEDGKVVSTKGDANHPFTRGALCTKVRHYDERIYSPDRVLYPMKRVGAKGEGVFQRITWDEALHAIVEKLQNTIDTYGGESVHHFKGSGTMGLIQSNIHFPFLHKIGASRARGGLCCPAAGIGWKYTVGENVGNRPESVAHTDLLIVWGMNMASTNMHMLAFYQQAKKNGAKMIVIDPYRHRTAKQADWFIPIRPGTDAALALGMMHVLVEEGMTDNDYIEKYTFGFEELKKELPRYTPEYVEEITGVPADDVRKLARMYGQARAPFIRMGMGLSRNRRGGMIVRTIACLPGLIGAFHKKGGGALMFTTGVFPLRTEAVTRPDLLPKPARVLDKVRLGHSLLEEQEPPVTFLFVTGGNPALSCPDQGAVRKGLARENLFTVVHEQFMTDTAKFADILLPATTSFESYDVYQSFGHTYFQKAEPVIFPIGEAWSNHDFYCALARKMGFADDVFTKPIQELALELLPDTITDAQKEAFLAGEPVELVEIEKFFEGGFPTSSGKLEFYSEQMARDGYPPLPTYSEIEDGEDEGDLHLLTPPAHYTLNTSFGGVQSLREKEGRPTVRIHPEDAKVRGITEDGWVKVYNDRGSIRLWARLVEDAPRGVVAAEGVWWTAHVPDGNPLNLLPSDRLTDMGWGSTLHDNRVRVRKINKEEEVGCREV
ncbi:molybdopterin-containing oxidoreductase family protein [Effusibacillus consociatus]|uniref:Molybdopterin-dependent oxidoreductase n=1 Tax=Effusibacillus consociatus TaxID=1117041 RepID=A0ABV9Q336_9BACL